MMNEQTSNPTDFDAANDENLTKNEIHLIEKDHLKKLQRERSVADLLKVPSSDLLYHTIGLSVYILVFIIYIPYVMFKKGNYDFLLAYCPNVDMIATNLGYNGGPNLFGHQDFWKYLYNPNNFSLTGYVSSTIINYFALLGASFIIARATFKTKSWYYGWSIAFIILITTYLLPGNFLIFFQDYLTSIISENTDISKGTNYMYVIVVSISMLAIFLLIKFEQMLLFVGRPMIIRFIKYVERQLKK